MKTIFKVGMKVYDQVFEPDIKGEILDVNMKLSSHPITVKFGSCVYYYTAEGCRGKHKIRTLSTSPYKIEGFEQKAPAPTYEEVVRDKNYIYLPENLVAPNKELADATVALLKLLFLRDYYNEGWQPDWNIINTKYCIFSEGDEISAFNQTYNSRVMCFKTEEIRDKFLEEQRELLEIAKPLL